MNNNDCTDMLKKRVCLIGMLLGLLITFLTGLNPGVAIMPTGTMVPVEVFLSACKNFYISSCGRESLVNA
jgi:hypothetical protein